MHLDQVPAFLGSDIKHRYRHVTAIDMPVSMILTNGRSRAQHAFISLATDKCRHRNWSRNWSLGIRSTDVYMWPHGKLTGRVHRLTPVGVFFSMGISAHGAMTIFDDQFRCLDKSCVFLLSTCTQPSSALEIGVRGIDLRTSVLLRTILMATATWNECASIVLD